MKLILRIKRYSLIEIQSKISAEYVFNLNGVHIYIAKFKNLWTKT